LTTAITIDAKRHATRMTIETFQLVGTGAS
jgi:hypothetical protein